VGNEHVLQILGVLPDNEIRFADVQKKAQGTQKRGPQAQTLAEALLEAEWLGCVALRNHEYEPEHWFIRRIVK
jgi:hypothetical protein